MTALSGWLGAFEVEWRQENPIDLELCTRCNACIRACPESAIDYGYQVDLDKCKAHRSCVTACGEIGAIDFSRPENRRKEQFDLVLDLSREPLLRTHELPQGYFAPGDDPLEQALAAQKLAALVGEFEKPQFFAYKAKICAHSRSGQARAATSASTSARAARSAPTAITCRSSRISARAAAAAPPCVPLAPCPMPTRRCPTWARA